MTRSLRFYLGIALVTAAILMLQVIETRILSVISWYYLSFFVISMAMFGLTAGAVWVYLKGGRFSGDSLSHDLAYYGSIFAVATPISLLIQLNLPLVLVQAGEVFALLKVLLAWAALVILIAVPFFFAGVVVSLALTRSPFPVGRVYGADLLGAAVGSLGALVLLNLTDGPSAVLWVSAVSAVGSWLMLSSRVGVERPGSKMLAAVFGRPRVIAGALTVLAAFYSASEFSLGPNYIKGRAVSELPTPIYERWNSFSRVVQNELPQQAPLMWGASPRFAPEEWTIDQRSLVIDGMAGTWSYRIEGDVDKAGFLRYDVTNLAYFLPDRRSAAVIGVGGGRDIISARLFGVEEITGIELNPLIMGLLTEEPGFTEFTGIADLEGTSLYVDEARSWFARSNDRFDVIQMSLIDTWAATGAGAYTLSENGLYTTEAWQLFLDHLTDEGVFTVSRWYAPGEVNETGRMLSLAMAAIMESGASDPAQHLFLAAAERIATLVVSRTPLSSAYIETLEQVATDMDYRILISPGRRPPSETLTSIMNSDSREELVRVTSNLMLDLTPSTDDRPFFFNQLPFRNLGKFIGGNLPNLEQGVAQGNLRAAQNLVLLIGLSLLLVIVTIVVPLRSAVADAGRELAFGGTAYFSLIGAGFMFFEIALLQRMSVFLGHPIYSLSIVLFSMILSAGFGSLLSERFVLSSFPRLVAWSTATAGYLFSLNFWLPTVLTAVESSPILVRGGLVVAVIAPAGLLLGFGFPTGMRLISLVDPRPTPWFWGVNGATGVLASSLAVLCSMAFGISTSVVFAAFCYLLLIPAAWVIGFAETRPDPEAREADASQRFPPQVPGPAREMPSAS